MIKFALTAVLLAAPLLASAGGVRLSGGVCRCTTSLCVVAGMLTTSPQAGRPLAGAQVVIRGVPAGSESYSPIGSFTTDQYGQFAGQLSVPLQGYVTANVVDPSTDKFAIDCAFPIQTPLLGSSDEE
jgi:hypothetical protein